jgi:hypothetical protein
MLLVAIMIKNKEKIIPNVFLFIAKVLKVEGIYGAIIIGKLYKKY